MGGEEDQPVQPVQLARETVQDAELRRGLGEAQAARTAAARGKSMALRLSFADRDACAAALSNHYAEGRIDGQELERRLTMLFQAVTRGDLRPVFEGLLSRSCPP